MALNLSENDKRTAEHLFSRIRVYDSLIETADQNCDFDEVARLESVQDEIRVQLNQIIFPA